MGVAKNAAAGGNESRAGAIGYQPALDGLRGVCLVAVLFFHSDFAWMSGGFLGVSTFFTLSGFLITSLLVGEQEQTGAISLGGFWERRLRRLMPAAVLAVGLVVLTAPVWLPLAQQERLAGDAVAAITYLVNWRFVQAEYAYELIFTYPSPLQHFWSLAIEAQFYLFFPLLVGALLRFGVGVPGLTAVLGALTAGSTLLALAPGVADEGQHRIYYGSDTRAAEILLGGMAALVRRRWQTVLRLAAWFGVPALAAIVAAWSFAEVDDRWLYGGGFAAYAVASAVLILSATTPGAVTALLSPAWLRWMGRVSYGAYLYHWPVFVLLSAARTGLDAGALLLLRVTVTLAAAGLSARYIEEPIRKRRWLSGRSFGFVTASAVGAVALVAFALSPVPFSQRLEALAAPASPATVAEEAGARPQRWALFGDSTALSLAPGVRTFARATPGIRSVRGDTQLGCGVLGSGELYNRGGWKKVREVCRNPPERWANAAARRGVDVAIVLTGAWESRDWRFTANGQRLALGDRPLDDRITAGIADAMDALTGTGATVVWLTAPHIGVRPRRSQRTAQRSARPARQDRLNELVHAAAAGRDQVIVVDLARLVEEWPGGEFDLSLRPDSTHFGAAGASAIVAEALGPEIRRRVSAGR